MKKYIIIFITFLVVVLVASTFLLSKPPTLAIDVVLDPASEKVLVDFDCSSLPCEILGPRTNDVGVELREVWYEFSIQKNSINGLENVGFVVSHGDRVFLSAVSQDQPDYYIFLPQLDISHQFIEGQEFPLILETKDIPIGDYQIALQDSLNPEIVNANFTAGVLRVE